MLPHLYFLYLWFCGMMCIHPSLLVENPLMPVFLVLGFFVVFLLLLTITYTVSRDY